MMCFFSSIFLNLSLYHIPRSNYLHEKYHPIWPSIFQGSDDMYALCLSMLCVANFAAYERKVLAISSSKRLGKHLPIEEMTRDLERFSEAS